MGIGSLSSCTEVCNDAKPSAVFIGTEVLPPKVKYLVELELLPHLAEIFAVLIRAVAIPSTRSSFRFPNMQGSCSHCIQAKRSHNK